MEWIAAYDDVGMHILAASSILRVFPGLLVDPGLATVCVIREMKVPAIYCRDVHRRKCLLTQPFQ